MVCDKGDHPLKFRMGNMSAVYLEF